MKPEPSAELLQSASHLVCQFANGSCDCLRLFRRPCESPERIARAIYTDLIAEIERTHSLRKRKGKS